MKSLVDSIQESTTGEIDFDWLHEIGCTCDDTELPHHVSTPTQIQQLMVTAREFLTSLPKPTLITMSRSVKMEINIDILFQEFWSISY